jgi:MerR-like DNA binding protein
MTGPVPDPESGTLNVKTSSEILDEFDITYRQLYYWTTGGFLGEDKKHTGNGGRRHYTDEEVRVLERMLALVKAGVQVPVASWIAKGDGGHFNQLHLALEACRDD